ncbi:unnamed protein product [Moneuplotes crassus]|uniref:Peptidyl-tRNA hydrolase n=1 Tax=Euplotes crassus TaxID=5936 RepID=A0AAD1Y3X7_EUPCR|nr:unnamed protein product [Moneuplotes crassus]
MKRTELKLIVGLGNYGNQYVKTKHNVGFLALDYLSFMMRIPLRSSNPMGGDIGEKNGVVLFKPRSYMNILGANVANVVNKKKIEPRNIILLHDELELGTGVCKYREGNLSHKGHNGIKSVQNKLRNNEFKRIRIGIDRPKSRAPKDVADYVLKGFNKNDLRALEDEAFPQILNMVRNKFLT